MFQVRHRKEIVSLEGDERSARKETDGENEERESQRETYTEADTDPSSEEVLTLSSFFDLQVFWEGRTTMLEQLLIFTRGGLVLWTCQELGNALKGSPIDALIRFLHSTLI